MTQLVDLSQEIFTGMPVFQGLPTVSISVHATHEEWDGVPDATTRTPGALQLSLGDHTGTHVDALSHMGCAHARTSIDRMPLLMFYTEAVCLDVSHAEPEQIIEVRDLEEAACRAEVALHPGDTVLLYTDHYRRAYGTPAWARGPGLSGAAARWLGEHRIAAFGPRLMLR
jgi:kynurenine formamidase